MGFFSSKSDAEKAARDEAVAEYKRAHKALNDNSEREWKAGIRDETEEYHRLNKAACDAAENPNLPWWRR